MYMITRKRRRHVLLILKKHLTAYGKKIYSINSNWKVFRVVKNIYINKVA